MRSKTRRNISLRKKNLKFSKRNPKVSLNKKGRKSKARKFSNQHEVESLFEKHGFKKLYLEDLTPSQQLASMAKAKVVAGLHGAGLTNLIACRPSTAVLELTVGNSTWSYAKLAQALDLHYQMENIRPTGETTAAACLHTTKKAIKNLTSNHQNS